MDPKWFESVDHIRLEVSEGRATSSIVDRNGEHEAQLTGTIPEQMDKAVEDARWLDRPLVRINHDLIREVRVARERGS